jgi:hypothetical protein
MPNLNVIADESINNNEPRELDEFGRDESERTVVLSPRDAELIDAECTQGKHATYDDALHYVVARGLAEIKRVRDAARAAAEKTLVKAKRDSYQKLLQSNPSLVASQEFVATMLADLGVTAKAK